MAELRRVTLGVVYTDAPGAACRIARESATCEGLVVVGGDGTIFEVLDGMDRDNQVLAVIPTGRGNCLARDLAIRNVPHGFLALEADSVRNLDLLAVEVGFADGRASRFFSASTVALGYVMDVVNHASDLRLAGQYGYALATIRTIPDPFDCKFSQNGNDESERSCTGIVINNTRHLANFLAFKDAAIDDGLVDIMILDRRWFGQTLHNLSILTGLHIYDPSERYQSRVIQVSLRTPMTLMVDGQLYADVSQLTVECLPSALRCIRNATPW